MFLSKTIISDFVKKVFIVKYFLKHNFFNNFFSIRFAIFSTFVSSQSIRRAGWTLCGRVPPVAAKINYAKHWFGWYVGVILALIVPVRQQEQMKNNNNNNNLWNNNIIILQYVHNPQSKWKWNESGSRPLLCTYRLNWARRTSWG